MLTFTSAFRFSPAARRYVRSTSAASRRDAKRVKFRYKCLIASKAFVSLKNLALKGYLRAWLKISDLGRASPHPISFPPGPHIPRKLQEKRGKKFFVAFFFDFLPFQVAIKILHRKNDEKNAKIKDFGLPKPSQNPSKILPKSMFQKTCKF